MSNHGQRILGATIRRTCRVTVPGITARQYSFYPSVSTLSKSSQATELVNPSLSQRAACPDTCRKTLYRQSNAGRPLQDVVIPVVKFRSRLPPPPLALSSLHPRIAWSRWISPDFQPHRVGALPVSGLSKRQTLAQRIHSSGVSSGSLQDKSAKQGSGLRLGSKSTASPEAIEGPVAGQNIMDRLPNMSHIQRPSKEELLAAATGFWSRLKVRFKWFSIRSGRPFNVDEISAFFSWILLGHVLWIILGTTTFFSLAILAVNTVFAQGLSPPSR